MEATAQRSTGKAKLKNELPMEDIDLSKATDFERVFKGNHEKIHDLFVLKEEVFLENEGWRFYEPKIVERKHKHFYHSISKGGMPMIKSSENSGHYHLISFYRDADGKIKPRCSPPMRMVLKKRNGKEVRVEERVFYGAKTIQQAESKVRTLPDGTEEDLPNAVVDNHTHEVEFLESVKVRL